MTWRELRTFVRHLPRESALARALHGEAADWAVTDHLLAHTYNLLLQANASKRVPESHKIHPPGEPAGRKKPEKVLGAAELNALFDGGG